MKRKHLFNAPLFALTAFVSCAGTPPPAWVESMEAAYPRAKYIAQKGEGATSREAEMAALNAISFYFESAIEAEESGSRAWTEGAGGSAVESRTETRTLVRSQTNLAAVRYAEGWHNLATGAWETAAYIDRAEGWAVYEQQAAKVSDALLLLADAAEKEADAFSRALRFGAALDYADSAEFNAARGFSQILYPEKARALFARADAARAGLPEKIYTARQKAAVFIDCPADVDGIIYGAALAALAGEGFPAARERGAASCVFLLLVDEGEQKLESGVFLTPSLTGTVSGAGGAAVFSFTANAGRVGAINPGVAKRRAYTALAAALKPSFSEALNKKRADYDLNPPGKF